jgi:DNA repair protein RecO (recombination protein O)
MALIPRSSLRHCIVVSTSNEVLLRLLHRHDPHDALFEAYQDALQRLHRDIPMGSIAYFRKHCCASWDTVCAGSRCCRQRSIEAQAIYDYTVDRGPRRLIHPELNRPTEGIRIRGASLLALMQESLGDPVALRDAKALMRAALARHLGDQPLHSRKLFRRVVVTPAVETIVETSIDKAGC